MFDSLNRVDWDLLHRQKQAVLCILETKRITPSQAEALEGIVNLLDALQDEAAADGRWTFPGEKPEEEGAA